MTTNGHSVSLKWLVGVMGAMIGAGTLLFINSLSDNQRANATSVSEMDKRVDQIEVDMASLRTDLAYIRVTLLRIESKLER